MPAVLLRVYGSLKGPLGNASVAEVRSNGKDEVAGCAIATRDRRSGRLHCGGTDEEVWDDPSVTFLLTWYVSAGVPQAYYSYTSARKVRCYCDAHRRLTYRGDFLQMLMSVLICSVAQLPQLRVQLLYAEALDLFRHLCLHRFPS